MKNLSSSISILTFLISTLIHLNMSSHAYGQVCTISSCTGTNPSSCSSGISSAPCTVDWDCLECAETGAAPADDDEIIIEDGLTVNVTDSNEDFDGSIRILDGGILNFPSSSDKLSLTEDDGGSCEHYIVVEDGGLVTEASSSNQLKICGVTIGKGGGGCTDAHVPDENDTPPYCLNSDGLSGPVTLTKDGASSTVVTLPVKLAYFAVKIKNETTQLNWGTSYESVFNHFEVEKSKEGRSFNILGTVSGVGESLQLEPGLYILNLMVDG